jgi:hypothetical protein
VVKCRLCGCDALHPVLDLGTSPPSNAYLTGEQVRRPETWFPLRMNVCTRCWLMQTEDFVTGADVFTRDYAYFSSMSESWLRHAQEFVTTAAERLTLGADSLVIEVASNDGYLLRYVQELGIPCVGVEPTDSTADAAESLGLTVERTFLTQSSAREIVGRHGQASLVVANNVIAHVPDILDFARGLAVLTKPDGIVSLEFAYGINLVLKDQFDTVYHEHFSYLTLTSLNAVLREAGLSLIDVEKIPTHGGSLRVFAQHDTGGVAEESSVGECLKVEAALGASSLSFYSRLQNAADICKNGLLRFLINQHEERGSIAGYGAAAKGNTLLNYAGVRPDLLPYVVDRSPGKVGKFLPGSRIPILPPDMLAETNPQSILLLPWNLQAEIVELVKRSRSGAPAIYVASPTVRRIA